MNLDHTQILDLFPINTKNNNSFVKYLVIPNVVFIVFCILIINIGLGYKSHVVKKEIAAAEETPLLHNTINNTESVDKLFIYKGNVDNNYIMYNNLLWRILRINSSGSMSIVLDSYINIAPFKINDQFNLIDYLNEDFLYELDKTQLVKNNFCSDTINDLNNITCNNVDNNYVSLLDINSFINSFENGNSFIANNDEQIWLSNYFDDNNVWHTNGNRISYSDVSTFYEVKPVITLNNKVVYENGNGTKEDPYVIKSKNLTIGSTVKLGNDIYLVYSTKDNIKLVLKDKLEYSYKFDNDYKYLYDLEEKFFYEKLSYKKYIIDNKWNIDILNDNKLSTESINKKVGSLSIFDFKINNDVVDYYMSASIDNHILVFNNPIIYASNKYEHFFRPCIAISKKTANSLKFKGGMYVLGEA